jgi:hypothetical protein
VVLDLLDCLENKEQRGLQAKQDTLEQLVPRDLLVRPDWLVKREVPVTLVALEALDKEVILAQLDHRDL